VQLCLLVSLVLSTILAYMSLFVQCVFLHLFLSKAERQVTASEMSFSWLKSLYPSETGLGQTIWCSLSHKKAILVAKTAVPSG